MFFIVKERNGGRGAYWWVFSPPGRMHQLICAYMRQWYMLTVLHNAPVPHFTSGSFLRAIDPAYAVSFSGIPAPPPTSQRGNPAYRCGPGPCTQTVFQGGSYTGLCSSCFQYSVWPRILMAPGLLSVHTSCPCRLSAAITWCFTLRTRPPQARQLSHTGCRALILCVASRSSSSGDHTSCCAPALYRLSHIHTVPLARIAFFTSILHHFMQFLSLFRETCSFTLCIAPPATFQR